MNSLTYELQESEITLQNQLNNPPRSPKFEFWQKVTVTGETTTPYSDTLRDTPKMKGQIVGMDYVSVGVSLQDGITSGWRYVVQVDLDRVIAHEDQLV